jgi:hypothetical protein
MVGLLDLEDYTLHRPSSLHLVTCCGLTLDHASAGPWGVLEDQCRRLCPECSILYVSGSQGSILSIHRPARDDDWLYDL